MSDGEPRAMSIGEILKTVTPESIKAHESTFRRGYMHGACVVLDAVRAGVPIGDIEEWLDGPLMDWRFRTSRFTIAIAPPIKRRAKK